MKTDTQTMTEEAIAARMHRINQEIASHTWRVIEFPSIEGNKQRTGEIEKLKAEFQGLKWKLGEIQLERGAE
jgi:hypothetical protein